MSPVDAIRPPRRKKKPEPAASATRPVPARPASPSLGGPTPPPTSPPVPRPPLDAKERLVWVIAGIVTVAIFAGWLLLFQNGKLTKPSDDSLFGKIGNQIEKFIESVKTDIFKIKNGPPSTNTPVTDEEVKKLEDQVFPQFNDPTKQ